MPGMPIKLATTKLRPLSCCSPLFSPCAYLKWSTYPGMQSRKGFAPPCKPVLLDQTTPLRQACECCGRTVRLHALKRGRHAGETREPSNRHGRKLAATAIQPEEWLLSKAEKEEEASKHILCRNKSTASPSLSKTPKRLLRDLLFFYGCNAFKEEHTRLHA